MNGLELILFETRPERAAAARSAGIGSFIVDLEWRGKGARQLGADTEINRHRPSALARLREAGIPRRLCRINGVGRWTGREVTAVLARGATEILVPMVRAPGEVEAVLEAVGGRCSVGMLVETTAAIACARLFRGLPLSRVYVGLNDLAIERRSPCIFSALVDGTIDAVREALPDLPFGVAGATVMDGGFPLPFRLLLAEIARLDSSFTFLRRSFQRDIVGRDATAEIAAIQAAYCALRGRSAGETLRDRRALVEAVASIEGTIGARA